ncbi:MAG: hypothetical protein AAF479_15425 [Pseudomonadota bacterium]
MAGANGAIRTEDQRTRYEDAVDLLKRIAAGTAKLTLPADPDPDADADDPVAGNGPAPVILEGTERLFTRAKLRDL